MYQEIIIDFDVSIKAAMDLLPIAIFVQFVVLNLLPSKQSSGKAAVGAAILGAGREA
jgi:hypothetical protein